MTGVNWIKKGRIFMPSGTKPWSRSYTHCPVADPIGGSSLRIYYGIRDDQNRTSISFIEVDSRTCAHPPCSRLYRMWYSVRGAKDYRTDLRESYRIGYAESNDGFSWVRMDEEAGIDVSAEGWDSEMIAYAYVVRNGPDLLMFYNGNGFGRSGIGVAISPRST